MKIVIDGNIIDASARSTLQVTLSGARGPQGAEGAPGADGQDGADGQGIPLGGLEGQILAKLTGDDYDTRSEERRVGKECRL